MSSQIVDEIIRYFSDILSIASYIDTLDWTHGENPDFKRSSMLLCRLRAKPNLMVLKNVIILRIAPQIVETKFCVVGWFPYFFDLLSSAYVSILINLKNISRLWSLSAPLIKNFFQTKVSL